MSEFDFEPIPGLPAQLPKGERLLWQGSPDWRLLARRAFHVRKVTLYFALLCAWHVGQALLANAGAANILLGTAWLALLGAAVVGLLTLLAWFSARGTVYSITSRRVVLRHGIALPLTVNVPFASVQSVEMKAYPDGSGELALSLIAGQRLGYLINWPHVRPWRISRPESMLRTLRDVTSVGELLLGALRDAGVAPAPAAAVPLRSIVPAATAPATTHSVAA